MTQGFFLIIELVVVALGTIFSVTLQENFDLSSARLEAVAPYLLSTIMAAVAIFPAFRTNRQVWRFTLMPDYLALAFATVATVFSAVAIGFNFNRLDGVPRSLPLLQGLLILFLMVGLRILTRAYYRWGLGFLPFRTDPSGRLPERGGRYTTVIVVGLNELTGLYLRAVAEAAGEIRVAGVLVNDDHAGYLGREIHRHPILGTVKQVWDVVRLLEVHGVFVDRIVVTGAFNKLSQEAQEALLVAEKASAISLEFLTDQLGLGPRSTSGAGIGSTAASENAVPAYSLYPEHLAALAQRPYWRLKRTLDCAAALALLIILSPLVGFVAAGVAINLGFPIAFWQERPGRFGRPFKLYKLRTMAPAHDASGRRLRDEERTSRFGDLLRRTRLDELPQLFSIVKGDMSFVGPRPLLPVDQPAEFAQRLLVRPGLTGWAQVKGGRDISATEKGALDAWYVHNASFALDIKVLALTGPMLISGEKVDGVAIKEAWTFLLSLNNQEKRESKDAEYAGAHAPFCAAVE